MGELEGHEESLGCDAADAPGAGVFEGLSLEAALGEAVGAFARARARSIQVCLAIFLASLPLVASLRLGHG
ncbi:hypothetical protein [Streptomyces sp. URMC 123]|uniref:hypothetical protein n=1 Tax=Streptomyces sp. URMC 123 TaxID=3423403 RepID=UPI003F1C40E3